MAEKLQNSLSKDKICDAFTKVMHIKEQLDTEKGEYMKRCKVLRDEMKDVFSDAKNAGVPLKPLKEALKRFELERKAANCGDGLDALEIDDFKFIFDSITDFAGTPLGKTVAK